MDDFNLEQLERRTIIAALDKAGTVLSAAQLLGITRHSLRRRIVKLRIEWPAATVIAAPEPATVDGRNGGVACV